MASSYPLQDIWDDYAGPSEEQLIASILGPEADEETETRALYISPLLATTGITTLAPGITISLGSTAQGSTALASGTTTRADTKAIDILRFSNFPPEIRSQILEAFLPPLNTTLKASLRTRQQTALQLPQGDAKLLQPLLLTSESLSTDIITLLFSRCVVCINHDSCTNTIQIFKSSSLFSPCSTASPCSTGGDISGFVLGCLRRMKIEWAPGMEWDEMEVKKLMEVLRGSTGLMELRVGVPVAWWGEGREEVWMERAGFGGW